MNAAYSLASAWGDVNVIMEIQFQKAKQIPNDKRSTWVQIKVKLGIGHENDNFIH